MYNSLTYTGVRNLTIDDENLQDFYEDGKEYDFYKNEYIKVKNKKGETIYLAKWNGNNVIPIKWKQINNEFFGRITARNDEQRFAFDMLQDDSIIGKCLVGNFGTGKTFLGLSWALDAITSRKPRYDKICYIRNNCDVKDTVSLGALPSDLNAKLLPWAMPLVDILGDKEMYEEYIEEGKIVLDHMGFLRGRSFKNTIVYCTESQNLSSYHMALLVSRIGEGSCLVLDGDIRQSDKDVFTKNSGLKSMIEKFKGNPMFGVVELKINERSPFASLADLLMVD